MNVDDGIRLLAGIIIELMHRKRQNASVSGKDRRGAVAVVDVQIHHHRTLDQPFLLERPDCHCYVVDRTEAFAMGAKRVMKSAADIETDAIPQGVARSQNGASRRQPDSSHHFRRIRNPSSQYFLERSTFRFSAGEPNLWIVHAQDVEIG